MCVFEVLTESGVISPPRTSPWTGGFPHPQQPHKVGSISFCHPHKTIKSQVLLAASFTVHGHQLSQTMEMFDINLYYVFTVLVVAAGGIPKGTATFGERKKIYLQVSDLHRLR